MKSDTKHVFKTSEFILICVLVHNGLSIDCFETDPINPRRAVAVFSVSVEFEALRDALYHGSLLVEPVSFWETVRKVKEQIRSQLNLSR